MIQPDRSERVVRLGRSLLRVGRLPDCQLVLRDSRISRHHLEISWNGGQHWVADLGSRHGTFVNGERIERRALAPGDVIEFGSATGFRLVYEPPAAARGSRRATKAVASTAQLEQLCAMLEAANRLFSHTVLEEALAVTLQVALEVTRADCGAIFLANAAGELEPVLAARGKQLLPMVKLTFCEAMIELAARSRRLQVLDDPRRLTYCLRERGRRQALPRVVLAMPLESQPVLRATESTVLNRPPALLGVLYLEGRQALKSRGALRDELLRSLVGTASAVIENALRYAEKRRWEILERQLALARQIHEQLLPERPPTRANLSVAAAIVVSWQFAGDFYDWVELPDGSVMVLLADVAGKGPPVAPLAVFLRGIFAATATCQTPAELVTAMNRVFAVRGDGERFAAVSCVRWEPNGRVQSVCAGNLPALLHRRDGRVEWLQAGGFPVGLFADASYGQDTTQLLPGDRLILLSDGVTEALDPAGNEFGLERLVQVVAAVPASQASELLEAIQAALLAFTQGALPRDDRTVVVLVQSAEEPLSPSTPPVPLGGS